MDVHLSRAKCDDAGYGPRGRNDGGRTGRGGDGNKGGEEDLKSLASEAGGSGVGPEQSPVLYR